MKRQTSRSSLLTSSMIDLSLSSNSPRYLVPATMAAMSSEYSCLLRSFAGTLPSAIICARPSATAVLPTPGGPTRQALFFRLRSKIWMILWSSFSRPTTGSSKPSLAIFVRSVATLSSDVFLLPPSAPTADSSFSFEGGAPRFASCSRAARNFPPSTLKRSSNTLAAPLCARPGVPSASSSCSVPTTAPAPPASALARSKSNFALSLNGKEPDPLAATSPRVCLKLPTASLSACRFTPRPASAAFATRSGPDSFSSARMPKSSSSVQTTP
mmetsp:Transcript_169801/g.544981  ORF Transcript_169801/g.544981 Transcript_169801/m.544981 type:complete len:270 (-) Transcript_169801:420-1229(-)